MRISHKRLIFSKGGVIFLHWLLSAVRFFWFALFYFLAGIKEISETNGEGNKIVLRVSYFAKDIPLSLISDSNFSEVIDVLKVFTFPNFKTDTNNFYVYILSVESFQA